LASSRIDIRAMSFWRSLHISSWNSCIPRILWDE
jgi:hypothetical protein